jgi:hypothetical protein
MKRLLGVAALFWVGRWAALMFAAYLERRRPTPER